MPSKTRLNARSNAPSTVNPMIEMLDARQLLSASLNPASHLLTITGTGKADAIVVDVSGSQLKVTDNRKTSFFARSAVTKIAVNLLGGNDTFKATDAVLQPMVIHGGDGNDTIRGGGGKDELYGDNGADVLDGGMGDDNILGGAGVDAVDYTSRTKDLYVSLDNRADDGQEGEIDNVHTDIEVVKGGSGDDFLVGSAGPDTLNGFGGNDLLAGMEGNDVLIGGTGADELWGGHNYYPEANTGNDELWGGDGNDLLLASRGNNILHGGNGDDELDGNDGADKLFGDAGKDHLSGGDGNDFLKGGEDEDEMYGGNGDDYLDPRDSGWFEIVSGGAGTDTMDMRGTNPYINYKNQDTIEIKLFYGVSETQR